MWHQIAAVTLLDNLIFSYRLAVVVVAARDALIIQNSLVPIVRSCHVDRQNESRDKTERGGQKIVPICFHG
jgi:hypothetical protein